MTRRSPDFFDQRVEERILPQYNYTPSLPPPSLPLDGGQEKQAEIIAGVFATREKPADDLGPEKRLIECPKCGARGGYDKHGVSASGIDLRRRSLVSRRERLGW